MATRNPITQAKPGRLKAGHPGLWQPGHGLDAMCKANQRARLHRPTEVRRLAAPHPTDALWGGR